MPLLTYIVHGSSLYLRFETYILPLQIETAYVIYLFKFGLLRHIPVGENNISFWERLNINCFMIVFVHFTIAIFSWYNFTLYSIVLPMSISARVFHTLIIYF